MLLEVCLSQVLKLVHMLLNYVMFANLELCAFGHWGDSRNWEDEVPADLESRGSALILERKDIEALVRRHINGSEGRRIEDSISRGNARSERLKEEEAEEAGAFTNGKFVQTTICKLKMTRKPTSTTTHHLVHGDAYFPVYKLALEGGDREYELLGATRAMWNKVFPVLGSAMEIYGEINSKLSLSLSLHFL
ncbi:hypothetical protein C8R42DRAFT_645089 [Lentinula raphanica]|nr:hypothetical protein C8R42DRAFT_645089 [Lentinula raphanica]